jgi:pimeloyl-ACP methyl ester carboxylesterase/TRAP-type C4-dicarboxylate transport system substrate-binding protein
MEQFRDDSGATLSYETVGDGPCVLAIHGAYSTHHELASALEPLLIPQGSYRRIYPDIPGMGMSPPHDSIQSSNDVIDLLEQFMDDQIGRSPFAVIGHSYGAHLARGLAARRSRQVSGMALICPLIPGATNPEPHAVVQSDIDPAAHLDPSLLEEYVGYFVVQTNETVHRFNDSVVPTIGQREVGALGTYTYDDEGNWVASEGEGSLAHSWSLEGDVLTLSAIPPVYEDAKLVGSGEFRLERDQESDGTDEAVTLNFANTLDELPTQIQAVLVEAENLSEASLGFTPANRYAVDSSSRGSVEAVLIEDVRSGAIKMGWVGARALEGFEPLLAPMLVDSYELQFELFERGLPQQLPHDPALEVIAVLPGPIRKIMGVDNSFLTVEDFAGQTIAGDVTPIAEGTTIALGGIPVASASGMSLDGINGVQAQLAAISGNGYETVADSVTANLNLWPRALVIIMNKDAFDRLTPEQQKALKTAGPNSLDPAMEATLAEDEGAGEVLCASDMDVIESTNEDLAAFVDAVQPVYEALEENPAFAAAIEEIRLVKEELDAPPATLECG